MRRFIAVLAVVAVLLGISWTPAQAGSSTDIALGLASFAVFNQLFAPLVRPHPSAFAYARREVVYPTALTLAPTVVYAQPAPVVASPTPYPTTIVQYPNGRYELALQGQQYVWVWVPATAFLPPPPLVP